MAVNVTKATESDQVLELANQLKAQGTSFAFVTVVRCESPTSAKPGAKAVVTEDGTIHGWIGGGCAQPAVISTAKKVLKSGQAQLIRISPEKNQPLLDGIVDFGMACHSGGTLDIFVDPIMAKPHLLIIGASPAAQALSTLASRSGFAVSASFPGADSDMFPDVTTLIDSFDLTELQARPPAFIVVATQGKKDEQGLEAALTLPTEYIALIASARKADKLRQYLLEREQDEQRVNNLIAPAGVELGAVTPEEIALSVLAGLVKAHRVDGVQAPAAATASSCCGGKKAESESASCCGGSAKSASSQAQAQKEAIDPICEMTVTIDGAEYTAEYQGKTYYFCCAGCQHKFKKSPQEYAGDYGVPA